MHLVSIVLAALLGILATVSFFAYVVKRSTHKRRIPLDALARIVRDLGGVSRGPTAARLNRGKATVRFAVDPGTDDSAPTFDMLVTSSDSDAPDYQPTQQGELPTHPFRAPGASSRNQPIEQDHIRPVVLRAETSRDRFGKALLINKEWQSGDDLFDRHVYVETSASPHVLDRAFSDPRARDSVVRILDHGWKSITLLGSTDRQVSIAAVSPADELLAPQNVSETIDLAILIAKLMPKLNYADPHVRNPSYLWLFAGLICADIVAVILAFVLTRIWTPIDSNLSWVGLGLGSAAWVLSVPLAVAWLRGEATSLRRTFWVLIFLAVLLPIGAIDLGVVVNGVLDFHPSTQHTTQVQKLWSEAGEESTEYYMRVEPWSGRTQPMKLHISHGTMRRFEAVKRQPRYAKVTVHPGLLGFPWWSEVVPATVPTKTMEAQRPKGGTNR